MVIVGGMLRLLVLGSHHPRGRALLSVLGIALGVALGYGVYLVNRAAVDELAAAVRGVAGEADLEVRGGRGGFPDSLYPAVARLPGVASASPGLELDAGLAGTERTIRLIGIDALRERRPELLTPDKVLLSAAAAELAKGDRLRLVVGHRTVELQVGGVLDLKGVEALTDIATAQWRLGRPGQLDPPEVRLEAGAGRRGGRRRPGDRRPGRPRTRLCAGACGSARVGRGPGRRGVPRPLTQAGFFPGPGIFLSRRRNWRGGSRRVPSSARRGAPAAGTGAEGGRRTAP